MKDKFDSMSFLERSVFKWSATGKIPSWLGMLVYNELTSNVTSRAPSGISPICLSLLMKCCVSLRYELILGTYFFMCSFTYLLMFDVGWLIELQIGLPGISFLWIFDNK